MTIGRISGPMLFANLERQGLDLSIEGNLIYFDVNRRRIGINTDLPEYTLHVAGDNGFKSANVYIDGTLTVDSINAVNVKANLIGITNQYDFPVKDGPPNSVLQTLGTGVTEWVKIESLSVERLLFNYTIPDLPSGVFYEFPIDIGISSVVYGLTVSRPCLVEVFGSEEKNEPNPYTFLATIGHLTDDGTVFLNDGSIIQQRQYSIFANQETPPKGRVYARVSNSDGVGGEVRLSLIYFAAVTDNKSGTYTMNLVDRLPLTGFTGQTVVDTTDNTMYSWYNNRWNLITDNKDGTYNIKLVSSLPTTGFTGQIVINTNDNAMYSWYNNKWNVIIDVRYSNPNTPNLISLVSILPSTGFTGQIVINTNDNAMYSWYNNKWNRVR